VSPRAGGKKRPQRTSSTAKKKGRSRRATGGQEDLFAAPPPDPAPEPSAPGEAAVSRNGTRRRSPPAAGRPRVDAASMAKKQREISVSEFFAKNRHLLGFDNPAKALLTTIKEAVDNSLDACEEAGILPEILVEVTMISEERFRVAVQDNGPGIVKAQVPRIFGQLLYGSKFHRLRQSRGQQGIGISAAGMYGQLTTGKPVVIRSRVKKTKPAHEFVIRIDTKKNAPKIVSDREADWEGVDSGTRVEIELEATYRKGPRSVDAYLEQTALANPHVALRYVPAKGDPVEYPRADEALPVEPREIQPHPHGVELGVLMKMLGDTKARNVKSFLTTEFSRVSARSAAEILERAKVRETARPSTVARNGAEALHGAVSATKLMAPPTNCLSPIGAEALRASLEQQVRADFTTAVTRSPSVYRGNPFLIEVALAYGGELSAENPVTLYRFANRVPLLYQQGACAVSKAVIDTAWRNYRVQQSRGSLPIGPVVLMVHIASVWVPFTSESKEAIAHYPEIIKEIKLAVQDCGRRLATHIRRGLRERDAERKRSYIEKYIPHIGIALREILDLNEEQVDKVVDTLKDTLERSRKMG